MTFKYKTVFQIIFKYRVIFIIWILWLISNIIFIHKLLHVTDVQYKENLIGLTKNESELLEKLSDKLRSLEKMD
uniref:Uncharacterized protein n=1 Tax=Octopus bimaculoides TaxID=37653 RepID=A0A0L8HGG9_OCTBM